MYLKTSGVFYPYTSKQTNASPELSCGSYHEGDDVQLSFPDVSEIINQANESLMSLEHTWGAPPHILNPIATTHVTNALAIAKCTKLGSAFNQSNLAASMVQDLIGMSLRAPGDTRWNSTFDAVRRSDRRKDYLPEIMEKLKLPQFLQWIRMLRGLCHGVFTLGSGSRQTARGRPLILSWANSCSLSRFLN